MILGGVRDPHDEALLRSLQLLVDELDLHSRVQFEVNAPYCILEEYLRTSMIGLHSMWNEHFGISVVEMMAAGLVTVAHKSGGPLMDIIRYSRDPETDTGVCLNERSLISCSLICSDESLRRRCRI